MSNTSDSSLEWILNFEPDFDGEEELAEEEEVINKALITDDTITKCRIIASVRCVEYGEIEIAPNKNSPAALLVIDFVFHPFEARVKEADVELAFNGEATIAVLQPETVDDSESEETIRHKLYGEFSIGYPPAGINATAGNERETERTKKFALRIRGSGNNTKRATWTLRENPQAREGIHLNFMAVVILQVTGQIEVDVEIRAKIAATVKNVLGIRKIITTKTKTFDGKSFLGTRPQALKINESLFKAKPSEV